LLILPCAVLGVNLVVTMTTESGDTLLGVNSIQSSSDVWADPGLGSGNE